MSVRRMPPAAGSGRPAVSARLARDHWRSLVIGGFVIVASLLLMLGAYTHTQDSDSVLPAIISIEKLTWYYWGQDRFGNLLPFLASPIRSIALNFHTQLFLRSVCGFLSIFFVLRLVGDREHLYDRFFVSVLVLALATRGYIATFFVASLSQPISCAVFLLGLLLVQPEPARRTLQFWQWLAAALVFWVAFFVNLSLVVFVVPLALVQWWVGADPAGPFKRLSTCAAIAIAAAGAWGHARLFTPHTPAGFAPYWNSLNMAVQAMLTKINLVVLAALLPGAMAAAVISRCRQPEPNSPALVVPLNHVLVVAMLVVTATIYANASWVQINNNASRYYNTIEFFALVLPATWAVTLVRASRSPNFLNRPGPRLAWRMALPALALAAVTSQTGFPVRLAFLADTPGRAWAINQDLPGVVAQLPADLPMVAMGDYWRAVPLVYARLERQGMPETYAIGNRWEVMRPTIRDLLQSGRPFTLVCLPVEMTDCSITHVQQWSGAAIRPVDVVPRAGGALESGGTYAVLSVLPSMR